MELIPSIDLRRGKVVRLEQGDDARTTIYPFDPLRQLETFADAGIERVHLVDLDAAFGEAAQVELLRRLCNAGAVRKLQLGGGLRSASDVERALGWGFERVVLGSMVVRDPEGFATLANSLAGRLVPALDCRAGFLQTNGWSDTSPLRWKSVADRLRGLPCPAILVTDVERDGLLGGPNLELAAGVASASGMPAIVSGGVASLADLVHAAGTPGVGAAIVGRAFYEGKIELMETLRVLRERARGAAVAGVEVGS
jgi:phosphoribosylformimino-5-aminoimidazole carboxamide ribotide isomerase